MSASPESLALLERAAELRAAGAHSADAAKQLAVGHDELRRLASEHYRDYERLSRRARNDLHRQAVSATIAALINLMQSPEPGVGIRAATTLVRYHTALLRHRDKGAVALLERDAARRHAADAEAARARNVQESTKVPNQQGVPAAKNAAQSTASAPAKAATAPTSGKTPPPTDELARRRARLADQYAMGRGAPPLPVPDGRLDREIGRIVEKAAPPAGQTPPTPPVNPA